MSKQGKKESIRKDKESNVNSTCCQTVSNKKTTSKIKTIKPTSSISSPEDWPTLGETVNAKEAKHCVANGDISHSSESKSCWDRKAPQKIGQLVEQSNGEVQQSNGSVANGELSTSSKKGDETPDSSKSDLTSNCDPEEEDSSKENKDEVHSSSGTSASDRNTSGGEGTENVSTPRGKKKGSKNRWRPLVIEPQSSKHHERKRGQRFSRRRDNSLTNYENGSRAGDDENRNGPPDKSYSGSRRGRGRGYSSSFGRSSFRGRSRNYDGNRSQSVVVHDDYPANIAYYVDYEPITDQTITPVSTAINGDVLSPTVAQATTAFVTPTGAVSTSAFVAPFFTPFAALPAATYDPETLRSCIRKQVEYYFSEENLQRDFFLRRKMDSEGYLPISLIASFQRVQALTQDMTMLIHALDNSTEIDLSEDQLRVRTKHDPLKWPIADMRFQMTANEKNASVASGDSSTAKESNASSDLHPDVPDFIPGQPYGYGYDGAPATNRYIELTILRDNYTKLTVTKR